MRSASRECIDGTCPSQRLRQQPAAETGNNCAGDHEEHDVDDLELSSGVGPVRVQFVAEFKERGECRTEHRDPGPNFL